MKPITTGLHKTVLLAGLDAGPGTGPEALSGIIDNLVGEELLLHFLRRIGLRIRGDRLVYRGHQLELYGARIGDEVHAIGSDLRVKQVIDKLKRIIDVLR